MKHKKIMIGIISFVFVIALVNIITFFSNAQTSLGKKDNEKLRQLLCDEKTDDELKKSIIVEADFSDEEGIELLKGFVDDENEYIAYQAIKKLYDLEPEYTAAVAYDILHNYENEMNGRVNIMLQVLSSEYYKMRLDNISLEERICEETEFIEVCINLIDNSDCASLRDAAVFALSDMTEPEAVSAIIASENVDYALKVYAINQNYMTLKWMAGQDEYLEIVCKAMDICPLRGLQEDLENKKNSVQSTAPEDTETIHMLEETIQTIKTNGNSINPMWIDLYNGGRL